MASARRFDHRFAAVAGLRRPRLSLGREQEGLVTLSQPDAGADRRLYPDDVGAVAKPPILDYLERLAEERVDRPEKENAVVGGRQFHCLDFLEAHRWVVLLGRPV